MIVISSYFEGRHAEFFTKSKYPIHFHNFEKALDFSVWNPKIIIISSSLADLQALPSLGEATVILMTDSDTKIHISKRIETIICLNGSKVSCFIKDSEDSTCDCLKEKEITNLSESSESFAVDFDKVLAEFLVTHKLIADGIYIIGATYRINVATFIVQMEHEIAIPNDTDFDVFVVNYLGYRYLVAGIHQKYREQCERLAEKLNMKMVNGKPLSSYNNGTMTHFPLSYAEDCTYTLEILDRSSIPNDIPSIQSYLNNELKEIKMYLDKKMK